MASVPAERNMKIDRFQGEAFLQDVTDASWTNPRR